MIKQPRRTVITDQAPPAIGPYVQAVVVGDFVFCSGCLPLDLEGQLRGNDITEQTTLVLKNLTMVLAGAGLTLGHVVKTTVFLQNMADFADMNAVYQHSFSDHFPARTTIQIAALPKNALVEIEAIAHY